MPRKRKTRIVAHPGVLDRDELELNYMLLSIGIGKLMESNNIPSVLIDVKREKPPEFNLNVNWNADEGVCTICTTPLRRTG